MNIKDSLKNQYNASLDMLKQAIERCPPSMWDDRSYNNVFWHIAYHALFFTHLYLQPALQGFVPWSKGVQELRQLGHKPGEFVYSKDEILEYLEFCRQQVEEKVISMDLDAPSGFHWLPPDRLEQQIYNLRHIQQHLGELCERLGANGEVEVNWIINPA
ncbi:MAG: DinB family protein [Anaerolineae bacterium]